jgi:hypothetical protein
LVLYALMGLANLIRGVNAWMLATVLTEIVLPLPLLGAVYLLFGMLFLVAGGLYFRKPERRARWLVRGTALGYQIIVWVVRLVGDRGVYTRRLWGRDLIFTVIFLALVFLISEMRVRLRR